MGPVQMPLQAIHPAWKHQAAEGKVNTYSPGRTVGFTDL